MLGAFRLAGRALKALSLVETAVNLAGSRLEQRQSEEQTMSEEKKRTFVEEFEVEGRQLVERVRELIREGNVRRLRIKDARGKYLIEVPLTMGVVGGGVLVLAAPTLAALSALAGLVANVRIEIVREAEGEEEQGQGEGES
jgi:vacuolar-type H+-ATPase subunit I/STV1